MNCFGFQTFATPKKPEEPKKEVAIDITGGNFHYTGQPSEQGVQELRCDWIDYKDQDKSLGEKVVNLVSGVVSKAVGKPKK